MRRKLLLKCDWSVNPQSSAMSVRPSLVDAIIVLARSTRRMATYAIGEDPRLRLNARLK